MKSLIVTADDFGLAPEVNEAVEVAHRRGILNCASLMVGAPAAADAVARAHRLPGLAVGLHLVLVEGKPLLPPAQVPGLVDADGRFRNDMVKAGIAMFFSPSVRRQLAAEIEAQFAAFAATGLALDHVNAHKHFHVHPTIGKTLLEVGARYGLGAVRVPIEPRSLLRRVEPSPPAVDPMLGLYARLLRQRLRRAGMATADRVVGIAWSGAMHAARVAGVLRDLPEGCTE
ncbi:MAG: hopanoid biosynthesis-associated protein HpnK, partial [Pseudomonadota bacterium]|nr:hopanoid biosynthesis-associated protein HpnK [Pseudomonadota bacterium]